MLKNIYINPDKVCLIQRRMLWLRSLSCTGLSIQLETSGGNPLCKVVEQYGCASKDEVKSWWVMSSQTFSIEAGSNKSSKILGNNGLY